MDLIPHSKPWITEADIDAVTSVLASSMLGQGVRARLLEQQLAVWLQAVDGVTVGSGAAGIVLALHGLGIGPGDEVVLPTYVCRSVLEAVLTIGASPVLADVGPDWVMTAESAANVVGSRTRAIIVPHLYGIFADIEAFRRFGAPIIEDCAQAFDAAGKWPIKGDVAVLSLQPTKCLTAGEGGIALASDWNVVARMRAYRDGAGNGYSGRLFAPLSDIAAGLALSQLARYEQGLSRRRDIAESYLETVGLCCPSALNRTALERSMFFRFPLRVLGGLAACQQAFAEFGVSVKKGVDELLHRGMGLSDRAFPMAIKHFDTTISLPIYPALSRSQESCCVDALARVLPRHFSN